MAVPTRKTGEGQLNEFNAWLKTQPWYQQFFASRGLDMNRVELSRGEQSQLESLMASNGVSVPSGMHIDQAGNLNQKNTLARNIGIGAAIGGAALTGAGALGAGPLSGMFGGGAAASGAAGGAASGGIPTLASSAIGSGMGYGPASLAGTSALAGGGAASAAIPAMASRAIGSGMGTTPSLAGSTAEGIGSMGAGSVLGGSALGSRFANGAKDVLTDGDDAPAWLKAAMAGMAGLPAVLGNNGPGSEEKELIAQAKRLLQQQEQRTNYANPLYEATMQMAYGLLPQRPGGYPGGN